VAAKGLPFYGLLRAWCFRLYDSQCPCNGVATRNDGVVGFCGLGELVYSGELELLVSLGTLVY